MAKGSFEGFPSPRPNKGGTNTGDATATAADIVLAKTAYAVGLKLVGTNTNKLYANGSLSATVVSASFTKEDNTTQSLFYQTVSGLNFPNGIDMIFITDGSGQGGNTFYSSHLMAPNSKIFYGLTPLMIRLSGNAFVTTTGFQLPTSNALPMNWYAWGL